MKNTLFIVLKPNGEFMNFEQSNNVFQKTIYPKTMKKIILFVFASFLLACEAPVGDVGPQGAAGAAGAKGDKGETGQKGTFNAIVSNWVTADKWLVFTTNSVYLSNFSEPKLTQQILDKGLILGFYRPAGEDESGVVLPIPDETANYSLGISGFMNKTDGTISIKLAFRSSTVKNPNLEDWNVKVRWIIVPPASTGRLQNIDWKNYNEVKKALNIQD